MQNIIIPNAVKTSPLSFPGCILWLKSDSLLLSDGDLVSEWKDSSRYNNHATSSGSNRPTFKRNIQNGRPVVRFSGSHFIIVPSSSSLLSGTNAYSIFFVLKINSGTINMPAWTVGAGNNQITGSTTQLGPYIEPSFVYLDTYADFSGSFHTFVFQRQVDNWRTIIDGTQSFADVVDARNISTPTSDYYFCSIGGGSSQFTNGDVAEIIIYNRGLDNPDRIAIESYLNKKYRLY